MQSIATDVNSIETAVHRWFGHDSFRPGQREAVEAVLKGRDAVVVMPTGSGKSLCYQLAAMMLPGTTLVISPLIALMKDQVDALVRKNCPATYLNSTVSTNEMRKRLSRMVKGEYKLVYIAPERLRVESFMTSLQKTQLSLFTIDEAHCISQWGHDFRPDYLEIHTLLDRFPDIRVMAVTATATPEVRNDIKHQLGLGISPRSTPFEEVLGFARTNLSLSVTATPGFGLKTERAVNLIRQHKTGIVYVATRRHAIDVFEELEARLKHDSKIELLSYHGAMTDDERALVQERFMQAKHPVVVATNAFGMGVDRADLRFVLHWDIPGGIEAYYQEIGRAGRDGQPSWCELLFDHQDIKVQKFFNEGANPTWDQATTVLNALLRLGTDTPITLDTDQFGKQLGIRNGIAIATILNVFQSQNILIRTSERRTRTVSLIVNPNPDMHQLEQVFMARREKAHRDDARLNNMIDFCNTTKCRHDFILRYFGDMSSSHTCHGCDNCSVRPRHETALTPDPTPKEKPMPHSSVSPSTNNFDTVQSLLRRYVEIQTTRDQLEHERLQLRDKLVKLMGSDGNQYHHIALDGEMLKVRTMPKVTYTYDEQLLQTRLGEHYESILEPDLKKLKIFMPEASRLLQPLLAKVGSPSRDRIREAIASGQLKRESFTGAFTRKEEISFAVSHLSAPA